MTNQHGDFIWYELLTTEADAAQAFYSGLLGWTFAKPDMGPDVDYRLFQADGPPVGGLMPITAEMEQGGARPLWTGYIGVDDVDASAKSIAEAGGAILMEPMDIPDVGRIAFVSDPQGAPFYIMRGLSDEPSESFAATAPREGHCAWNELATADPAAATEFYFSQFGWAKDSGMDMGPMGEYEFLRASGGRFTLGAMFKKPDEMPISLWSYYFRVPDIDVAAAYTKANGGQIMVGPMEIPGGEFSFSGMDPQGAMFGLVGKRNR